MHCLCTILFHPSIILWIFRHTWIQPHRLITPVIVWMASQHCCDLLFQYNSCVNRNLPTNSVFHLVPMGFISNPNTSFTECELADAWWFGSGCSGIIRSKVDIPSGFQLFNTSSQILIGEIHILHIHKGLMFEISCICHLVDDTLEFLCHSNHYDDQDSFICWSTHWMPKRRSCLYYQRTVGN